jgi:hypothetical protein
VRDLSPARYHYSQKTADAFGAGGTVKYNPRYQFYRRMYMIKGGYFMYPNWGYNRWSFALGGWDSSDKAFGEYYDKGTSVANEKGGWFSGASCDCIDNKGKPTPYCTPFAGRRCKYVPKLVTYCGRSNRLLMCHPSSSNV